MTDAEKRQKVIDGLELCLEGLSDICPYKDSDAPGGCRDELMHDALLLLKAQEPMRVVTSEVRYKDHLSHCPSCGKALPNSGEYGKSNYCYKCGQAVKWR